MSPRTHDEVIHQEMLDKIKNLAREQMALEGTASLSLRGIARAMNLSATALYRYFPSRNELITALIVDAFEDLARALAEGEASVSSPRAQLGAVIRHYRLWALAHPIDFQLIFGNPIPGYTAPREITLPAAQASFAVLVRVVSQVQFVPRPELQAFSVQILPTLKSVATEYGVAPQVIYVVTSIWTQMHGITHLELIQFIQPVIGEGEDFYLQRMNAHLNELGIEA